MHNPFTLEGKNIVITGASSGIGRQCAISCSEMGANVILIARNEVRLKDVLQCLQGENHRYYTLDLQDFNNYSLVVKNIIKENGKISGFIHSAGIEASIPLNGLNSDIHRRVMEINTISFFELIRFFSKNKNSEENTSFIAISSIMGILGQKGKLAYCSSKSALINGIKALALELASKKIRVNCISPAIVQTPMVEELFSAISVENQSIIKNMHPLGFGSPNDVANACLFLASDLSTYITGQTINVDGGMVM